MFINLIFNFFYRPQQLELTAVNEIVLMENINVFQMNGFDFQFQQDGKFYFYFFETCSQLSLFKYMIYTTLYYLAEPTKKVKLTMIPMSNNWSFGKEDVDELLFMLQVNSNFNMT